MLHYNILLLCQRALKKLDSWDSRYPKYNTKAMYLVWIFIIWNTSKSPSERSTEHFLFCCALEKSCKHSAMQNWTTCFCSLISAGAGEILQISSFFLMDCDALEMQLGKSKELLKQIRRVNADII